MKWLAAVYFPIFYAFKAAFQSDGGADGSPGAEVPGLAAGMYFNQLF